MTSNTIIDIRDMTTNDRDFDATYTRALCDTMYKLAERGECIDVTLVAGIDQKRFVFKA